MHKHTPEPPIKVTGHMNTEDSAIVGNRYADAALLAVKFAGIAALIGAFGYLVGNLHWLRWW